MGKASNNAALVCSLEERGEESSVLSAVGKRQQFASLADFEALHQVARAGRFGARGDDRDRASTPVRNR